MSVPSFPSSFPGVRVKGSVQYDGEVPSVRRREKPLGGLEVRLPEPAGWDVPVGSRRERERKRMSVTERARQRVRARQAAGGA